jgi:glycerophosphoryl diester phosphodiesterase
MTRAKKHGYKINVWTVDDPDEARRLVTLGVHGIITNKPQLIRDSLS